MIVLATDFSNSGPYVGQMKGVLLEQAPGQAIVDLIHDLPRFNIHSSAYLLPAYVASFPMASCFLCVVDPGVGGERRAIVVEADGRHFVGPDNGLFSQVLRRASRWRCWEIVWRPKQISASFHGRDLFAPIAAQLMSSGVDSERLNEIDDPELCSNWPDDLHQIVYCDAYGNGVTGLRAEDIEQGCRVIINGHSISAATTFSDVAVGAPLWYSNSAGLLEIAVNQGSAVEQLGLAIGWEFTIES